VNASNILRGAGAGIVVLLLAGEACAQEMLASWTSSNFWSAADDEFGYSVYGMPDIDGDGVPDALISALFESPTYGNDYGAAYLISSATGTVLQNPFGDVSRDYFGACVCAPGDLDGDGVCDFLVGEIEAAYAGNGKVLAYSGATGTSLFELDGPQSDDQFGWAISSVGDLDADGVADFLVSAPEYGTKAGIIGRVWAYSGATHTGMFHFSGQSPTAWMEATCGLGDLDGDGTPELAIGAPGDGANNEGVVTVYSGKSRTVLYSFQGEAKKDDFGFFVASLGDTDGDGYADLAVAAPGHTITLGGEGRVYVYSGASGALRFTFDGSQWIEELGFLPSNGGVDFNGDGYMDITIGSPLGKGEIPCGGDVYVYSGKNGLLLYDIRGSIDYGTGEHLGSSLSAIGDINGDGFDDLLVGAPANSSINYWHGQAYVFGGNDLFLQANQLIYHDYDAATLDLRGGPSGSLACIALTAVGTTPTFIPIVVSALDNDGNLSIGGTVPSGLAGTVLTFMGYAVGAGGSGVIDSIPETISFQ